MKVALFFDQDWFDAKLRERGATREDIARLLQLTADQISEMWKDQRELRAAEVLALAKFLNVSAAEAADRAGVSTPKPPDAADANARLDEMCERLTRIERMIGELKALTLSLRT
ncbi:MAG: helix-turn-helix transcriptional regulator [Alphaproteobacteria bacterium]|nr:helix-turn-helix transcriptional regulator [Alphaproteobacteria bacterium]